MRVLIINRYSDDFADYGRYIDHTQYLVSYVTVADQIAMIPEGAGHIEVVVDVADIGSVMEAATRCHEAAGFDTVLALSEFDLLTAARVREKFGCAGMGTRATLLFRDKVHMKAVIEAAGIAAPRHAAVEAVEDVVEFARTVDGPVVAKPRAGAASAGTVILARGEDHGATLAGLDLADYEAEEFVAGPIWHVDGLRYKGEDIVTLNSRYMDTCHGFTRGRWLGSVVQSGPTAQRAAEFAARCLDALRLTDGPYHLELIESANGLVFLEIGARVGGGEIPFTVRDVYGVDLMADWIRIALGEPPAAAPLRTAGAPEHAGFLMLPEPTGSTLVSRSSMLGRIPHLYAEDLPTPGHTFTGTGGYDEILGRFRYRGPTAETVEQAIERTVTEYHYQLAPTNPERTS